MSHRALVTSLVTSLGNALLWGIAIIAAAYLEVNTILWAVILPFNAFISVSTTYQLFK